MKTLFKAIVGCSVLLGLPAMGDDVIDPQRAKANFPHSDIFLFDLPDEGAQSRLAVATNITNRPGYDNQPFFTQDSDTILYTRGDDYQTDIYEYSIDAASAQQITNTPTKEFSPTPNAANTAIAYVSDRDGSVWLADRSAIDEPRSLFEGSDNPEAIGYFAWNEDNDDFFYWSRYGYSVVLSNLKSLSHHFVSGHAPPSTPRVIPGTRKFSFVHRQANEQVWIKEFDPETGAVRPLLTLGANHNYTWTPAGALLTIQDDVLYRAASGDRLQWAPVADLAALGVRNVNRMAVSPDGKKLAVVGVATTAD
ncbi:MAG: TolB family protein [Congregibacter sp.]